MGTISKALGTVFETLFKIFKPDLHVLSLFAILALNCVGGVIQSYMFVDDVPGVPKPPLYDQLSFLELWFPWIVLTLPLHILAYRLGVSWLAKLFPQLAPGYSFH